MAEPAQKKETKHVIRLLFQNEMFELLGLTKAKMKAMLEDGMPYYLIGNEKRFLEKEVKDWIKAYKPSQKRQEQEFRDSRGRTIDAYVSDDGIQDILRVSKNTLKKQCSSGMPYVIVGVKKFFNTEDILNYFRVGEAIENGKNDSKNIKTKVPKQNVKKEPEIITKKSKKDSSTLPDKKNEVFKILGNQVPKNIPLFIVDGSYNFNNNNVGTGVILINHASKAAGFTFVRNVKTQHAVICEYLAIMDALKIIKSESIKKAYIFTDQERIVNGIFEISNMKHLQEPSLSKYISELKQLLIDLKDYIELKYIGNLEHGKKNPIFKKAHDLSRVYKKSIIKDIEFV